MKPFIVVTFIVIAVAVLALAGCGSGQANEDRDFFTSGSRDADQRAEQRIAKDEQLKGDQAVEKPGGAAAAEAKKDQAAANAKKSLYERLGGEAGVQKIVDDFVQRVLADPRVNWERKGVTRGGVSIKRNQSVEWKPTSENQARLKKHLAQFIALATGGPTVYEGKEMKAAHAGLHITNVEFDAAVGDLKATLDKLAVPTDEQKELLAIIESTREQVAEKR